MLKYNCNCCYFKQKENAINEQKKEIVEKEKETEIKKIFKICV